MNNEYEMLKADHEAIKAQLEAAAKTIDEQLALNKEKTKTYVVRWFIYIIVTILAMCTGMYFVSLSQDKEIIMIFAQLIVSIFTMAIGSCFGFITAVFAMKAEKEDNDGNP